MLGGGLCGFVLAEVGCFCHICGAFLSLTLKNLLRPRSAKPLAVIFVFPCVDGIAPPLFVWLLCGWEAAPLQAVRDEFQG